MTVETFTNLKISEVFSVDRILFLQTMLENVNRLYDKVMQS